MQKLLIMICINAIVFLFLGILWYYPIMPFLFYNTIADSEMQQQMGSDLMQFYLLVDEIHQLSKKGTPLTSRETMVLAFTPGGEYGFLLWPIFGIILGLWRGLFFQYRLKKRMPATTSF